MSEPATSLAFDGRTIPLDAHGHLADTSLWSEALAGHLAAREGIRLGREHWRVIHFLRDHHARFGEPPRMRALVAALAQDLGDRSSRTLYRLFPDGPVRQASRLAGLPRPERCI